MEFEGSFKIWEATLLLSPACGICMWRWFPKLSRNTKSYVLTCETLLLSLGAFQAATSWSVRSPDGTELLYCLAYFSLAQLVWLACSIRQPILRKATIVTFGIPLAVGFSLALLVFPVAFLADSQTDIQYVPISPSLTYSTNYFGAAMTFPEEGTEVRVFKIPSWFPWLKHQVSDLYLDEITCTKDPKIQYDKGTRTLRIQCTSSNGPVTFQYAD